MDRLGRYQVLGPLGAGGMGEVYRAYDSDLQREIALKVLPLDAATDPTARARLLQEAQAASALNHPNIVVVHEVGEVEGRAYISMERVEGRSLEVMVAAGPLSAEVAANLAAQVADALAHAHARGIVHRDLKPANVVITPEGRAKVLDFGLARRTVACEGETRSLTETGTIVGKPDYLAPEVLQGAKADARADLWALGVMLHEMLAGQRPFRGRTAAETLGAILHAPPPRLPAAVPPGLGALVSRCLEKDPADRIQSAAQVMELLGAAEHLRARNRAARWGRVPPAWAAAALALAIVVALVLLRPAVERLIPRQPQSLAVLPLVNLSGAEEQAFFAEGMTDELTTTLGQIRALQVIAHADYDPRKVSLRRIARELGVNALVTGTVLRSGDQVRIAAQLLDPSGRVLWSHSYERPMRDVIALQNELSQAIAEKIRVELTPRERTRLSHPRTVDPEAYEDYLRGRVAWSSYTQQGFAEAERLFRRALERDSTWAPAWAGIADAVYGASNLFAAPNQAIPRARAAAEHALRLDDGSAEAHTSLGITRLVFDWDWDGADAEFRRALDLQSGHADAHWWLGHLLVCRGRTDDGLRELQKAVKLDPGNGWYRSSLGWHLYFARRYREAADSLQALAARDPGNYNAHVFLGLVRCQQGDHRGAVTELERAVQIEENNDDLSQLGYNYARADRRADAERVLARLEQRGNERFVPAASYAMVYAGLGDRAQALHWLERGLEDHSEKLLSAGVEPALDEFRGDPRFEAVLRRIHLRGDRTGPAASVRGALPGCAFLPW